ncbi:MAG TPA: terminase small subunit [Candidatus Scatovicinus merdipullorum]|nr:terminase small subunit [Candidatus Scatovicinus merdipullorum]
MEKNTVQRLTKQQRLFCRCYVNTGNAREAAVQAGFIPDAQKNGEALLCKSAITKEIARLLKQRREMLSLKALSGYERLAFGSIADGIRLLYIEDPLQTDLESMDLFNIAEIKKPKDGAMEIKFFDRLKALEKLMEAKTEEDTPCIPFYTALQQGAQALERHGNERLEE